MPAGNAGGTGEAHGGERDAEREALIALVRARHGARLGPAELEDVARAIDGVLATARALRAVHLANSDEPAQPFAPSPGVP